MSARRLLRSVSPTRLDLSVLGLAVDAGKGARAELAAALAADGAFVWERAALEAGSERDPEARGAALGELLTELEGSLEDGARVPRVCASVATSVGFLCATAVLLQGLAGMPEAEPVLAAEGLLVSALTALAAGVAGATFCAAAHVRARRSARASTAAAEALVSRLMGEAAGR